LYQLNNNGNRILSAQLGLSLGEAGEQNRDNFRNRTFLRFFANTPKFGVFSEKSKIVEN